MLCNQDVQIIRIVYLNNLSISHINIDALNEAKAWLDFYRLNSPGCMPIVPIFFAPAYGLLDAATFRIKNLAPIVIQHNRWRRFGSPGNSKTDIIENPVYWLRIKTSLAPKGINEKWYENNQASEKTNF